MKDKCTELRTRIIEDGLRDKMKLRQPSYTPTLVPGIKIQYTFRYANKDDENDELIQQCTGSIITVSDSSNLRNPKNAQRFYRKDGTVEVK